MKFYDFKAADAQGIEVGMEEYAGKVILVVNTATECGFTPQYDELQDLYEEYEEQGLEILDFPCNQFGNQAPGSDEEIASFCDSRYGITFPRFAKVNVNGEKALPLFRYLQSEIGFEGFNQEHPLTAIVESILEREHPNYQSEADIKWNFTKFLINRNGEVVARFEPTEDMEVVEQKIKELL